jgi:hypothetical protein
LIDLFNNPIVKERETLLLFIGLAALNDQGLIGRTIYLWATDYQSKVIEKIPGEAGRLLREQGADAVNSLLPKVVAAPVAAIEQVNPFEIECERQKLSMKALENAFMAAKSENQFLLALSEEEKKLADLQKHTLTQIAAAATAQQEQILELLETVSELTKAMMLKPIADTNKS